MTVPSRANVVAADDQDAAPVDLGALHRLAQSVLDAEGVTDGELGLTFVDEDTIAALNADYLGEAGPTDVLAFPLDEPEPAPGQGDGRQDRPPGAAGAPSRAGAPRVGPRLLGDVVVCPAVASRYAEANRRPLDDELALLVVHGVLHVLGHDHAADEDAAQMRAAEHRHLTALHDPSWTWSGS